MIDPLAAIAGLGVAVALWPRPAGRSLPPRRAPAGPRAPADRRDPPPPRRVRPRIRRVAHATEESAHLLAAELLAVALSAGCSLHTALVVAGERRPQGDPLHAAAVALQRGHPLAGVLEGLADRGRGWQVLATTLAVGAVSGAPSVAAVREVAASQRRHLRRTVERRVRRLPVVLLLPLVGLVLPAFVLVTFVPVAVAIGNDWSS